MSSLIIVFLVYVVYTNIFCSDTNHQPRHNQIIDPQKHHLHLQLTILLTICISVCLCIQMVLLEVDDLVIAEIFLPASLNFFNNAMKNICSSINVCIQYSVSPFNFFSLSNFRLCPKQFHPCVTQNTNGGDTRRSF